MGQWLLGACNGQESPNQASASPAVEGTAPAAANGEIRLRHPSAGESRLMPPGAVIGADPDPTAPALTFSTQIKLGEALRWYRSPERRRDFLLQSELEEGAEHVLSGRVRATGEMFTLRLSPGAAGGTSATIVATPQ